MDVFASIDVEDGFVHDALPIKLVQLSSYKLIARNFILIYSIFLLVKMKLVKLATGAQVPAIGVGTYRLRGQDAERVVYDAVRVGYRHIDTAVVYKNEKFVGEAIRRVVDEGIVTRADLFVTSKVSPKFMGYEMSKKCIEQSLSDLGLDYVDLMLVHWPGTQGLRTDDPRNKPNRIGTMQALKEAYEAGIVKAIGVSNFNIVHFEGIEAFPIHVNQFEFHPLLYTPETRELMEFCSAKSIAVEAYSCLGEGVLLNINEFPEIHAVATELKCTAAQVLIAWALHQGCIVMPKASSIGRLRENIQANEVVLEKDHIETINNIIQRTGRRKFCWDPITIKISLNGRLFVVERTNQHSTVIIIISMNAVEEDALLRFLMSGQQAPPAPVEVPMATNVQIDLGDLMAGLSDGENEEDDATSEPSESSASEKDSSPKLAPVNLKRKMQLAQASKKHRLRQKDELSYLRDKVMNLNSQLSMLQKIKELEGEHGSQWEQLARSQFLERQKAHQENAKLKAALEEQLKFAEALQSMIQKKPRLSFPSMIDNEEWKLSKLSKDRDARRHAMKMIMDKQYELLNGILVRSGLFDPKEEIKQSKISARPSEETISIDFIRFHTLPWDYELVAEATWQVCTTNIADEIKNVGDLLEAVDNDTRYCEKIMCQQGRTECPFFGRSRANVIGQVLFKRFFEKDRIVIVWKAIMEDELYPRDPMTLLANQQAWVVIEKGLTPSTSRVKSYIERLPPSRAGKEVALDDMMKSMHIPSNYDKRDIVESAGACEAFSPKPGMMTEYCMKTFQEMANNHEEIVIAHTKRLAALRAGESTASTTTVL
ncbi:aldo-keto reductase [Thraustotheca clavata]|uniref:Aldo-keto reductase n=1 Tax=Thraustotheca clavata TaxID=74557 RepID=A0A1V9YYQ4_9STRA|nr:aldo-keto reductase [Thraustotheca clavata]